MASRNYIITIDDSDVTLAELAEHLRAAGFQVAQRLDAIGVITGRAAAADIPRIRAIRGVAAVEEERTVGPRSSDEDGT